MGELKNLPDDIFDHMTREQLEDVELKFGTWTISGSAGKDYDYITGITTIYKPKVTIKKDNVVLREYIFDNPDLSTQKIVFNPHTEFGRGDYIIILDSDKGGYASFKVDFPYTGYRNVNSPYKITTFSDYRTNRDELYSNKLEYKSTGVLYYSFYMSKDRYDDQCYFSSALSDMINNSHQRGKVLKEQFYTSNNALIKQIDYQYSVFGQDRYGLYVDQPRFGNSWFNLFYKINKVALDSYLLTEKTTKNYDGSVIKMSKEYYNFDNEGYLKQKGVVNAKGEEHITTYTNINDQSEEPYMAIKEENILVPIVKQETSLAYLGDVKPIDVTIQHYDFIDDKNVKIKLVEKLFDNDLSETTVRYSNYDQYGNPLEIVVNETKHVVALWSYIGKYPIAKIENSTYNDVKNALNGISLESISMQSIPDMDVINNLREVLPNAHISTYKYTPLIGISEYTDPSGLVTYYDYDSAGRLKETYRIVNGSKEIIESHKYNYVNQ